MKLTFTKEFNEEKVVRDNLPSLVEFVQESTNNSMNEIEDDLDIDNLEECDDYMGVKMEIAIQTLDAMQEFIDTYRHNIGELIEKIDKEDY